MTKKLFPLLNMRVNDWRGPAAVEGESDGEKFICPMHAEVKQFIPGNCPKCGMTLVLKTPGAGANPEANNEFLDMTKCLWILNALRAALHPNVMHHLG